MPSRAALIAACIATCVGARAQVVINELMYHPDTPQGLEEFIELYNAGPSAVSLDGWCFSGVTYCFPAGTTLPADGYIVLARNAAAFEAAYGFAPAHVYTGALDNSGEAITLRNAGNAIVDRVVYDDRGSWPVLPDGQGPSLERIAVSAETDTPRNWRASIAAEGHTVGAPNSVAASDLPPWLEDLTFALSPQPGQHLAVTVRAVDASAVELVYRVGFDPETTLTMHDDGAHGDGAAGDGVYGATIPGQAAGALVRFRVLASGPTGSMSAPRTDDSIVYVGTVVADPAMSSNLPIFQWFMHPDDYQAALDHYLTDEEEPAVLAYGGVVWDNARTRVRGDTSREYPKKSWKFRLPRNHPFDDPAFISVPVKELDFLASYTDKSYLREVLANEAFRDAGSPYNQIRHVRLVKDGAFFGLYQLRESMETEWLERSGFDSDGAWYKAFDDFSYRSLEEVTTRYEKKTRKWEDHSDLHEWITNVSLLGGDLQYTQLLDRVDLPGVINYLAVTCAIHNNDHIAKNYYVYRDTNGTQRWTVQPYDMDLTFGRVSGLGTILNDVIFADQDQVEGQDPHVSPSHPRFGDRLHWKFYNEWNKLIDALYEHPPLLQMYFRRLRTVTDQLLAPGRIESRVAELVSLIADDAALDVATWGQYGDPQTVAEAAALITDDYLPRRRAHLLVTHRVPGSVPEPRVGTPRVVINEIMYNPPSGPAAEFIELHNPSADDAVDVSGWRIDGADVTLPPGSVIPAGGYALVVADSVQFHAVYGGGVLVLTEFNGTLDNGGEHLVLRNESQVVVDSVRYDDDPPWPIEADGQGKSLERIDAMQPGNRTANWAASAVVNGTPGRANDAAGVIPPIPDLWVNEVLPVNASINTDETGAHEPWIEIYNASPDAIDLGGMHLTDDYAIADKWTVPAGTILCGHSWMIFWADNDPGDGPRHTNFALSPTGGAVGLFTADNVIVDYLNYDSLGANISYGKVPDGGPTRRILASPSPAGPNGAGGTRVILNEYNAVSDSGFLKNNGSDTFWGRIAGNGGDWFELVVIEDHTDMRGWQLEISDDTGGANHTVQTLTLTNHPVWSDLRSGTIVTISEQLADDASYDPLGGDWWINARAANAGTGALVTAANFRVTNDNWQLTIRDASGNVVFGPAGEGVQPASGIGNDEVFRLEVDPSSDILPTSDYSDGFLSSFGSPNFTSAQATVQNFSPLRSGVAPCTGPETCDDGNDCTTDACVSGACVHTPLGACYDLSLTPAAATLLCDGETLTVELRAAALARPVRAVRALLHYDADALELISHAAGDGLGSPWDAATVETFADVNGDLALAVELDDSVTAQDAVVARLVFQAVALAAPTQVAFRTGCAPFATSLIAGDASLILPNTADSGTIAPGDATPPVIAGCPGDITVRPTPGQCAAVVSWTPPTASDNCGVPSLVASHEPGSSFPVGTTTVTYTATDDASNTALCSFDVTVLPLHPLTVDLELDGIAPAAHSRCITFELYACPSAVPVFTVEQTLTFTDGVTSPVVLNLPCGFDYTCLAVRDKLHTLRRVANPLPQADGAYTAAFTGPSSLRSGNLNDDDAIDILDFAELVLAVGAAPGVGTNCETAAPHADLDGDGVVFAVDFTYIAANYLHVADAPCCSGGSHEGRPPPLSSISLAELKARGLERLAAADANGDGVVDRRDLDLRLRIGTPRRTPRSP